MSNTLNNLYTVVYSDDNHHYIDSERTTSWQEALELVKSSQELDKENIAMVGKVWQDDTPSPVFVFEGEVTEDTMPDILAGDIKMSYDICEDWIVS
jgi:hypothetical protein